MKLSATANWDSMLMTITFYILNGLRKGVEDTDNNDWNKEGSVQYQTKKAARMEDLLRSNKRMRVKLPMCTQVK
jgi:hypothetical protein